MGLSSRTYIDMIYKASSKWATFEPGKNLEAGDFGKINSDTGEFDCCGNIYQNKEILDLIPDLGKDSHKPVFSQQINRLIITGNKTQQGDFGAAPSINGLGIADLTLKLQFTFKKGSRGAFLAMYRPQSIDLPKNVVLKKLFALKPLSGMYLVTGVTSCPAYALCLSNREAENIRLGFSGTLPLAVAPGVSVGGSGEVGWVSDHSAGMYQDACDPTGKCSFKPLYSMKRKFNWRNLRDSPEPEPEADDDYWVDAERPWPALDSDGEEYYADDLGDSGNESD